MNFHEKKNLIFHLLAGFVIALITALSIYSFIAIIKGGAGEKTIACIATMVLAVFSLLQAVFLFMGGKKESSLKNIGFNENDKVNFAFLIPVMIGTVFGLALSILSAVLLATKEGEPYFTSSMVILPIGLYLTVNCLIYYVYLLAFKKRELDLRKLIK